MQPRTLTALLNRMRKGDRQAREDAAGLIYTHLHRLAEREVHREWSNRGLEPTTLVHEAYLQLMRTEQAEVENRSHFFALASIQMRRILIDRARAAKAKKRGGGAAESDIASRQIAVENRSIDLMLLDESLRELERIAPRAARVVELRFFSGLTDQEVTAALGVSLATVRRDWDYARAWLFARMKNAG